MLTKAELQRLRSLREKKTREALGLFIVEGEKVVTELFPGGDVQNATFWTGLRPMTPDSTPIIGATPLNNLFLNTGHGTLGWTMACGSGKLIADLVTGQRPEIRTDGLAISRYQTTTQPPLQRPTSVPA